MLGKESTEVDYNELGTTPRQIDKIIRHGPLSHDILETCGAAEAKYRPLIVAPTMPTLPQSAQGYAVEGHNHLPDIAAFAEYVDIGQHESVLDLGTGPRWVLRQLLQAQIMRSPNTSGPFQPPPNFVGVDASLSMVALARNLSQSQGPGYGYLRFVHDNIITLQSITGHFDVITCRWAFQHLPHHLHQVTLSRWKSLLTPGGRIDITAGPDALCSIFRDFIERKPDQKERSLLTLHYMEWCRDQATVSQPDEPQRPAAMLYTKNLALVAAVQPVED